ncbi:MAG: Isoquinoline 1-oxidoreductase subunit alpha [Steroidobacteraceae bacterium]|nr:Isoquinoline 1-oxidoreductase subunit alpha [Steroidobacteraceae bacterium]
MSYRLHVNGQVHTVDVPGDMPLLWVLRDSLGLVGTKFGCGQALCGACTVHVDGVAQRSCQLPVSGVGEGKITTIEHVGTTPIGARLQAAWLEIDVMQCGYCQAGQVMNAASLLATTPKPTRDDIRSAMAGNICRCACYNRIEEAIRMAAGLDPADDAQDEEKAHAV